MHRLEHSKNKHSSGSALRSVIVAVVLTVLAGTIFLNRQVIIDTITVASFTPSAELSTVAADAGLNDKGLFYLKASRAELSDKTAFNAACGSLQSERSIVLGCYTNPEKRIYVYNVTDSQLDGVRETTTAHEMLHAAYDRLSTSERTRIDTLLEEQEKAITDERILALLEHYRTAEPDAVVNELHSIVGTEVKELSPELEAYYARYFSDRSKVVALKEGYESVFADLANQQSTLVDELNTLAESINTQQEQYDVALQALNTDIESFNTWAQSGAATEEEFSSRREALQDRIAALNNNRTTINDQIATYTTKKSQLEALNLQAISLSQSINSTVTDVPSL